MAKDKPKKLTYTEKEIAKIVVEWLKTEGWDVYQEVNTGETCPVADIVAVKNSLSWIIEVKKSYSLQLLNQACYWLRHERANLVSIAALYSDKIREKYPYLQKYFHTDKGIGLIKIKTNCYGELGIGHSYVARLTRLKGYASKHNIKAFLREEQKSGVLAGSSNGGYETEFKQSVRRIERYVKKNPGCSLKMVIEEVGNLHWASPQTAKQCIAKYIKKGIIKTIRVEYEGRKIRLFADQEIINNL